jgi:hypothetical protein
MQAPLRATSGELPKEGYYTDSFAPTSAIDTTEPRFPRGALYYHSQRRGTPGIFCLKPKNRAYLSRDSGI